MKDLGRGLAGEADGRVTGQELRGRVRPTQCSKAPDDGIVTELLPHRIQRLVDAAVGRSGAEEITLSSLWARRATRVAPFGTCRAAMAGVGPAPA